MQLIDHTAASEAENLALDEALLLASDTSSTDANESGNRAWLRFWESTTPYVVLGRSSRSKEEVNLPLCEQRSIPVLRRPSGGATIVTGPGCLMYAVVINTELPEGLLTIATAHEYVLSKMVSALKAFNPTVRVAGTSDLVFEQTAEKSGAKNLIKFSGNSVRLVRNRLLYHGTLLYDFDLPLIEKVLRTPPRQPDYRERRTHQAFVGNLVTGRKELVSEIAKSWEATAIESPLPDSIQAETQRLVAERYGRHDWNFSR